MPNRIIAQSYDVIVYICCLHPVVEVCQHACLCGTLGMQYYLRLRTYFPTSLACILQQSCETRPVSVAAAGITFLQCRFRSSVCSPQHSVAYLVSRLNKVRLSSGGLHLLQRILCIIVYLRIKLLIIQALPRFRRPLLCRVGPCVAIMEVEHQLEASILYALAECFHVFQILTGIRILIASGVVRWIDKEAHTHGIHIFLFEERQYIGNGVAVLIKPCRIGFFVCWQQRNVAANVFLSL